LTPLFLTANLLQIPEAQLANELRGLGRPQFRGEEVRNLRADGFIRTQSELTNLQVAHAVDAAQTLVRLLFLWDRFVPFRGFALRSEASWFGLALQGVNGVQSSISGSDHHPSAQ
jgi:hypothetical protein